MGENIHGVGGALLNLDELEAAARGRLKGRNSLYPLFTLNTQDLLDLVARLRAAETVLCATMKAVEDMDDALSVYDTLIGRPQ